MHFFSVSLLIFSLIALAGCGKNKGDFSLEQAWDNCSSYLVNDASGIFEKVLADGRGDMRETQLGLAITLLDVQPKVSANLSRARGILESLISADDSDEVGIFARYVLGRYFLIHDPARNLTEAMKIFLQLFEQQPQSPVAQQGFATYAMVLLSPQVTQHEEFVSRVDELERRAERLTFPEAETMFHLAVAYASNLRGLIPEKVIGHLRKAQDLGLMEFTRLADTYVIAGNLALKIGDYVTANQQFSRFVKEFPRDVRNFTIQQKLNEINNVATVGAKENES